MKSSQVLTEPVIEQLSANCNKNCTNAKQDAFSKIDELETEIEKQMKDWNEQTMRLDLASSGFEKFAKFATDWNLNTFVPEVHRDRLLDKIENAHEAGYLTNDQSNEMKTQVINAAGFDPTVVPSIHDIAASTKQELAMRRRQADKKKSYSKMLINELKSYWKGLRSLSKTAMVTKASNALSGVLRAVGKFGAKKEDGTPDTIKILSGVGDIADVVGTFLPPPASAVTGLLSGILSMFGAGGPSTEDIVKEEFDKMKEFTFELFREQNKFIESQFEEQKRLIEEQTAIISENINEVIIFLMNDKIGNVLAEANSLYKTLDEQLVFMEPYKYKKISDETADKMDEYYSISKDTTKFSNIQDQFSSICLGPQLELMKVNQTLIQNKLCTNILSIFLTISAQRETVLSHLINKLHQTKYRGVTEGYLHVAEHRKDKLRKWIHNKIISNIKISCPLFVTHKHFWGNELKMRKVLSHIKQVDPTFSTALTSLNPERCKEVTKTNLDEFCQCPGEEFISTLHTCNSKRQCKYKKGMGTFIGHLLILLNSRRLPLKANGSYSKELTSVKS